MLKGSEFTYKNVVFCVQITASVKNCYKTKLITVLKIIYIVIICRGRIGVSQRK